MQYFKKEVSDEVGFVHADKHEGLTETDTMILMEMVKYFQSSQNSKFAMFLQYLNITISQSLPETLKYWVGVQRGQSYLMGKRCLFSLGW